MRCCDTGSRISSTTCWSRRGAPRSSTTMTAARRRRLEIFEFANSQLLEFRYYDALLARELARIYADLQTPAWFRDW